MTSYYTPILSWLINVGGICPDFRNGFGGDPDVTPKLDLKIQQRPTELAECINFLLQKKNNGENLNFYAEIGACSGGTTRAMHEFLNFEELLVIDDGGKCFEEFYVHKRDNNNRCTNLKYIPRIEIIGSSLEDRVIQQANNISKIHLYDILFIDGDHSYNGVKNDTINYLPILRSGGYLIFHDTHCIDDIRKWVNEMVETFDNIKLVKDIAQSDAYTESFPNGIGISIYQKT